MAGEVFLPGSKPIFDSMLKEAHKNNKNNSKTKLGKMDNKDITAWAKDFYARLKKIETSENAAIEPAMIMHELEKAFPELKESEDERIRKWIYTCIDNLGYPSDEDAEKELEEMQPLALAYLEKQKEQKSNIEKLREISTPADEDWFEIEKKWEAEDNENLRSFISVKFASNAKVINGKRFAVFTRERFKDVALDIINRGKQQKEQKPINDSTRGKIISRATSEKQVVLISESNGNAEIGWDTRSLEDAKKLLEYGLAFINKQLGTEPAEWSEEEKDLQEASDYLRDYANNCVQGGNSKLYVQSLADRIESLRPQHHWKPSEVQMEALAWYSGNSDVPPTGDKAIKSLYNDLQKLF